MNYALLAFLTTSLATTVGAFPAIGFSKISPRFQNATTGFSAGVMLAATCFSLLLPALEIVNSPVSSKFDTFLIGIAFLFGAIFLKVLKARRILERESQKCLRHRGKEIDFADFL